MLKDTQRRLAEDEINTATFLAVGCGAIPFAMVDIATTMAVQMRMLKKLCAIYEVKWDDHFMKSLLGSVLGNVAKRMGASMMKNIPFVGQTLGSFTNAMLSGMSTYAIGNAFVRYMQVNSAVKSVKDIDVKDFTSMYESFEKQADSIKTTLKKKLRDLMGGEESEAKPETTAQAKPKESIAKYGERMFTTKEKYMAWLHKSNPMLNGEKPIDLLLSEDEKDHEKVRRLITLHFEGRKAKA